MMTTIDTVTKAIVRVRLLKYIPDNVDPVQLQTISAAAFEISTAILKYLTCAITHIANHVSSECHSYPLY